MEFTLQSAGIPKYILCEDEGELVVKVGFWSAFKYLRKSKQKDEISLVSCYNGRGCRFFCLHQMNYINEVE